MKHPKDIPLSEWSEGWLKMEVASLLDVPGYILMSKDERKRADYPSTRVGRMEFIAARREADAFLASGCPDAHT